MRRGRYVYVLNYNPSPEFMGHLNCWGENARWPRPNSFKWKLFADSFSCEHFLFSHYKKKRFRVFKDWRPRRIYLSHRTYKKIEDRLVK